MKQYWSIVKLQFTNLLKFDKLKSKGFYIGIFAAIGVLYALIAGGLMAAIIQAESLIPSIWDEVANEIVAIMFTVGSLFVVMFGIMPMLNTLYFSRDTEFFLALPVNPRTVFAAKFTVLYITELLLSASVLLPTLLTLGIVAGMPVGYYAVMLLGVLFAPSIPMVAMSILAVPLMYIVSFFKNKGALTSIVVLILFSAFLALYFYAASGLQSMNPDMGVVLDEAAIQSLYAMLRTAANAVLPYLALARLASGTPVYGLDSGLSALINFALSFGIVAVLILIAVGLSGLIYGRGAAAQLESAKKRSTGKEKHAQYGVMKTLMLREWKMLIRTPYFAFQCMVPLIFPPLMVLFVSLGMDGVIAETGRVMWLLCMTMILMLSGMNLAAATAITREGKSFYLIKTFPVDAKTQMRAKVLVSTAISWGGILIASIILMIISPDPLLLILNIVILSAYAYGFNNFAALFDLARPKLDWTTPNEAMKQNMNAVVPLVLNFLIGFIPLLGTIFAVSAEENTVYIFVIYAICAVFAVLSVAIFPRMLNGRAERYFDRLS